MPVRLPRATGRCYWIGEPAKRVLQPPAMDGRLGGLSAGFFRDGRIAAGGRPEVPAEPVPWEGCRCTNVQRTAQPDGRDGQRAELAANRPAESGPGVQARKRRVRLLKRAAKGLAKNAGLGAAV